MCCLIYIYSCNELFQFQFNYYPTSYTLSYYDDGMACMLHFIIINDLIVDKYIKINIIIIY